MSESHEKLKFSEMFVSGPFMAPNSKTVGAIWWHPIPIQPFYHDFEYCIKINHLISKLLHKNKRLQTIMTQMTELQHYAIIQPQKKDQSNKNIGNCTKCHEASSLDLKCTKMNILHIFNDQYCFFPSNILIKWVNLGWDKRN